MAEKTEIAWCDSTFNPWEGCQKAGPGCDNCYAEARNSRFGGGMAPNWGPGAPRRRTGDATWGKPSKWNETPFFECPDCGKRGEARDMGDEPKDCKHLNAKPARRRVFCASLADVFDNQVDPNWRADLFFLIEQTPNLDWLLLTKRIGNVMPMVKQASDLLDMVHKPLAWPLPNVWLGATIVNQEEADRDIPKLLATPARVRFLSMEPLLGPVEFSNVTRRSDAVSQLGKRALSGIDWVIVGGESGPGARPMHPAWPRSLRDQCAAAGVQFLFKQWGEWAPPATDQERRLFARGDGINGTLALSGAIENRGNGLLKVGKKAAGRLLDGREHNEFPMS